MSKSLIPVILLTVACFSVKSQNPWQKISFPSVKELEAGFKSPPPEYGMILWWGWDGSLSDTVIKRDLDKIKAQGFSGVMVEAGYGMTAKYLSPEWFQLARTAVMEAKKRGMTVWIEDEGKYPSGFAGGKFSQERPDLKMQGLVITGRINAAPGQKISEKVPWYALSAVAYNNSDGTTKVLDISNGRIEWEATEGNWQILIAGHRFRSSVTRSVNNPTRGKDTTASLMDYLNPLATRQFLAWTHEQYKNAFGDEFGKTFMGFMGDEPDFAYTPWTPGILEKFRSEKGYDIKPYLASLFVPRLTEEARRMKADYWDVWSGLFRDNFFNVQVEWCRQNNIDYIVHLNHEDQLPGLVKSSGDYFRNMRNVGVPGVDVIWSQIWMDHVADYPKLASSAAHLFGKPRAFTESFAAFYHRPTIPQAKWVLDYQLVRGINSVQIMFMSASTTRRLPDAPPANPATQAARRTSFFLSDTFPSLARYINRTTYILSQGKPVAEIAVYFPTMSLWYGDNDANTSVLDLARNLMEHQYDFDFVDDQALSSLMTIDDGGLKNLSGQSYRAVIVPDIQVISKPSLEMLKKFSASGGRVIFTGKLPFLLVNKSFLNAENMGDLSWAIKEPAGSTDKFYGLLPPPDLKIDKSIPAIKYLHRSFSDADLYFIFNEGTDQQTFNLTLKEKGRLQLWDGNTGKILPVKSNSFTFDPWETKIIVVKK